MILQSTHFSQVKTDFVQTDACFYILHSGKKYGYDLVGEGSRDRWGIKSLADAQYKLKLEAK